jgi:hypothetical protein
MYMYTFYVPQILLNLKKKKEKKLNKINQIIYIRDLVVRQDTKGCFGEASNHNNPYKNPLQKRLNAHIASLFALANSDHRANNCHKKKGRYYIKEDKKNHITRLSTHEFMLYTKKPLKMEQFHEILKTIEKIANSLEPNVHVLLSSFAVLDKNKTILNISLYIEGGSPPTIHPITKNTCSSFDIKYKNKTLFSNDYDAPDFMGTDDIMIATKTMIEFVTFGGARCIQLVEICIAHMFQQALKQMQQLILKDCKSTQVIPEQVEQCVSSNTISLYKSSIVADYVLHVDPVKSMNCDSYAFQNTTQQKIKSGIGTITKENVNLIIPRKYKEMCIGQTKYGYIIAKPPFGSNYSLEVFAERRAGRYFDDKLFQIINRRNKNTFWENIFQTSASNNISGKNQLDAEESKLPVLKI